MPDEDRITLSRQACHTILEQAMRSPEVEVCGLIGATSDRFNVYPVENISPTPQHRFDMEPRQLITAMRHIRERGERLYAIYHSHPRGPAHPSATDIAEANYPNAACLIVSLNTRGVLQISAFALSAHDYKPLQLDLIDA